MPNIQRELDDVHRRIRNILSDHCPPLSWTLEESQQVLETLSTILRNRQGPAEVIDMVARKALGRRR